MNKLSKTVYVMVTLFLGTVGIVCTKVLAESDRPKTKEANVSNIAKTLDPRGQPIVKVKKEVYIKHPRPGVEMIVGVKYVGPGLERVETHAVAWHSDQPMEPKVRYSKDNGRTWSDFEPIPPIMTFKDKYNIYHSNAESFYDPVAKVHISIWLRQTIIKGPPAQGYNQSFWRISEDNARTWSEPQMIKYEQGSDFDPCNPLDTNFLENNQIYPGNNFIRHSNGTVIHACTSINIPKNAPFAQWGRAVGSTCFIGRWDPKDRCYNWQHGNIVWIPRTDAIDLEEAEVAELADGRVLVVWRAPPFPGMPGRKWYSVSKDGGLTLSEVKELKYDDTIHFYSPASFHRMIRHSITGKLYWIGNITPEPALGRYPRYPLVIAEVDETIPALKRKTVTIIDDRQPQDSKHLALTNFSLLEDRETHQLEIYLRRIGANTKNEENPSADPNFFECDCSKYTLSFD